MRKEQLSFCASTDAMRGNSLAEAHLFDSASLLPVGGDDLGCFDVSFATPVYRQEPFVSARVPEAQFSEDVIVLEGLEVEAERRCQRALERLERSAAQMDVGTVIAVGRRSSTAPLLFSPALTTRLATIGGRQRSGLSLRCTAEFRFQGRAAAGSSRIDGAIALCSFGAADLIVLRNAGWEPITLVAGFAYRFGSSLWRSQAPQEVSGSTQIWSAARAGALARLDEAARQLDADGVIAVRVSAHHQVISWQEPVSALTVTGRSRRARVQRRGLLVSVEARGTALRRSAGETVTPVTPRGFISLR